MITSPINEFDQHLAHKKYLDALYFTLNLKRGNKSPFLLRLRENNVFLKAMQEAVNSDNISYLEYFASEKFEFPQWFTDDDLSASYPTYRDRFLKAHIHLAAAARLTRTLNEQGLKDLMTKTKFPLGFILDLFHLLKNGQVIQADKQKRVQFLLASQGAIAGHLFIEQVKCERSSEPYPHPAEMFNISLAPHFQEMIVRAFNYIGEQLGYQPVFRWWVKQAPGETKIQALDDNSLYSAFVVGMLCSAQNVSILPRIAITAEGNQYGQLLGINDLEQKCQAAVRQAWKVIIAKEQDTNVINDTHQARLLQRADTFQEAMKFFTSGVEFELIDYLQLMASDCPVDVQPMTVLVARETQKYWDLLKARRAVIYGWEKVGKTQLLRHEAKKLSQSYALSFKEGEMALWNVNIPIFIQCPHLVEQGDFTFEEAICATLRRNGRSEDFFALIKEKLEQGQCDLLLDDFSLVNRTARPKLITALNRFAKNSRCRIIITVLKVAQNKKDGYGEPPLEIGKQSDEFILELLSPLSQVCPYKGLQHFDFNDEEPKYFHGRTALIQQLLEKVKKKQLFSRLGKFWQWQIFGCQGGIIASIEGE